MKKHEKEMNYKTKTSFTKRIHERDKHSFISNNSDSVKELQKEVQKEYISFFYSDKSKDGMDQIRLYTSHNQISVSEYFYFGLFLGFSIIFFSWILLLFLTSKLDADDQNSLFKNIFPIFRGSALFIMLHWLLTLNVYGWNKYRVNYKNIFKFRNHYSSVQELLKRSAFFTTVFLIMFIWYIIVSDVTNVLYPYLRWLPREFTPLIVFIFLFAYMLFPSKHFFNYEGRIFFFQLLKISLMSPFVKMQFKIAWFTDQLISLIGPIKDIDYTICYYTQYLQKLPIATCQDSKRATGFVIAVIPLFYRMLQCIRQFYDFKKEHHEYNIKIVLNFLKYTFSVITAVFSYYTKFNNDYFNYWVYFAIISTLYSYIWDLKQDWGFLDPRSKNKFLRQELCFHNLNYYYIAIALNFILRIAWALSISPDIINRWVRPELFTFFVYFLEAFRRCQWNFFRVELEHINNLNHFKAVEDYDLPYYTRIPNPKYHQKNIDTEYQDHGQTEQMEKGNNKILPIKGNNENLPDQLAQQQRKSLLQQQLQQLNSPKNFNSDNQLKDVNRRSSLIVSNINLKNSLGHKNKNVDQHNLLTIYDQTVELCQDFFKKKVDNIKGINEEQIFNRIKKFKDHLEKNKASTKITIIKAVEQSQEANNQ